MKTKYIVEIEDGQFCDIYIFRIKEAAIQFAEEAGEVEPNTNIFLLQVSEDNDGNTKIKTLYEKEKAS